MLGIWLEEKETSLRTDLDRNEIPAGEVRIRPSLLGVCRTDLELMAGYYPYRGVLGHEFVGLVEDGPEDWIGKRVVGGINATCGHCESCLSGRSHHCSSRTVLGIVGRDGCFADSFLLPARNLIEVPEHLSDECAVFTEPLAAAMRILEQVPVIPGDRWLVVGDGRLGQLVARVLATTGVDLTVLGKHERKLSLLSSLGITGTVDPDRVATGQFDVAVECAGNDSGFELARRSLRPEGTLILKSTYAGQLRCDASALVVDEIRLIGSRCGPFRPALAAMSEGKIDPRDLIDEEFALSRGISALEKAGQKGVMKVLIRPS